MSLNVSSLSHTFENFDKVPGTEDALSAFKAVIGGDRHMLLCYGGVGNGKTYLCEAASIELYKQGTFCRVCTFSSLLDTLKRAMNSEVKNYGEILRRFCFAERLMIDDVGAGTSGKVFADTILEEIVVTRYREELLTIVTTNKDLKELPERVVSRFKDTIQSYLILNSASDYRGRKEKRGAHQETHSPP